MSARTKFSHTKKHRGHKGKHKGRLWQERGEIEEDRAQKKTNRKPAKAFTAISYDLRFLATNGNS